ncbi:MAG: hypothetical protein V7K40_26680 [Nostoc sp.]|uniref:hypothetical protein n=1 Tax=Nostoc sp. TaxID=1180 RepID=UPI002FF4B01E
MRYVPNAPSWIFSVRYGSRNTTPVATTDSAALASHRASGTSLRVTLLRRYRYANVSRLRRETRLQRWTHRNALAPLKNRSFVFCLVHVF